MDNQQTSHRRTRHTHEHLACIAHKSLEICDRCRLVGKLRLWLTIPAFFALEACLHRTSEPGLEPFPELTEAQRSRPSVRPEIVTHDRHFPADMHPQHAVKSLAFGLRDARKLPQMLRPGAYEHLSPECSGIFHVLVDVEKKSAIRKRISLTCSIDARNFPQSSGRTMNSIVTVTGPSSSFGAEGKSCKPSNGAGSSLRVCAKLIESGIANARLALRRMAPPTSVLPSPKEVVDPPQGIAPSATPPCDTIMCTAFIRPRAQSGIARWPAIQSSDADTVQLMPARAAIGRKSRHLERQP
jgi:hypothetical protein